MSLMEREWFTSLTLAKPKFVLGKKGGGAGLLTQPLALASRHRSTHSVNRRALGGNSDRRDRRTRAAATALHSRATSHAEATAECPPGPFSARPEGITQMEAFGGALR